MITSSLSDEMNGMIMMPITIPATSADSLAIDRPIASPVSRKNGATVMAASGSMSSIDASASNS